MKLTFIMTIFLPYLGYSYHSCIAYIMYWIYTNSDFLQIVTINSHLYKSAINLLSHLFSQENNMTTKIIRNTKITIKTIYFAHRSHKSVWMRRLPIPLDTPNIPFALPCHFDYRLAGFVQVNKGQVFPSISWITMLKLEAINTTNIC